MADMTNAIANFGMQAGQNIQNTVGNALARNEERRRYQNEMAIRKQEQDQLRQQAADAAEREYGKGWSAAYFSAPEDKRPLILQGGIQKAVQQGFLKPEEAQSISEDYMYRLAAETGATLPSQKAPGAMAGKPNPANFTPGSMAEFVKTGDYGALVPVQKTPLVNVVNQAQSAGLTQEQKELANVRVGLFRDMQESARSAEEQNLGLNQIENIDVNTGFGEQGKAFIAKAVNALGGNGAELTGVDPANVEAVNAITGKLVLDVMASQKGPQTDADQARIAKTLPSISNEEQSFKFTLNALKGLNYRKIEMADFYREYLESNNGTLKGADTAWNVYKRKTPLLSDNVKNPNTGLPMFYHEFRAGVLANNRNASEQQVIEAWQKLNR